MHENLRIARARTRSRARSRSLLGLGALTLAVGVALAGALPASAALLPEGKIVPVSVDDPGSAFVGGEHPSVSAEGRYVAFASESMALPGANGSKQIYLRDLQSGAVTLISHRYDDKKVGGQAFSDHPAVSADGKFVAFTSMATDLVSATLKTNGVLQVYRWDSSTGAISPVSVDNALTPALASSAVGEEIDISDDGSFVVFSSEAKLTTRDPDASEQVYWRDIASQHTAMVSETRDQKKGAKGDSTRPSISPNGFWVSWESDSAELVPDAQALGARQVYAKRVWTWDWTELVSEVAGTAGDGESFGADVSDDGTVSFGSFATNLVAPKVTTGRAQVYVSSPTDGSLTLVSHLPGDPAAASDGTSTETSISSDGETVLFVSDAADLAKTGGFRQIFQWSASTNASKVVSVGEGSTDPANAAAFDVQLSSDGLSAAFDSNATDLVSAPVTDGNRVESYAVGLSAFVQPTPTPTPAPTDGTTGGTTGVGTTGAAGSGAGGSRLANTGLGVDGAGIVGALGAVLLAGGAGATLLIRRRGERGSARG